MTTHKEMAIVSWFFTGDITRRPVKFHEGCFSPGGDFYGRESFAGPVFGRFLLRNATKRNVGPPEGRSVAPWPSRDAEIAGTATENGATVLKYGLNSP